MNSANHIGQQECASLPSRARVNAQRGVSLIFALIALVALSLATLALVRSVDTSTLLLGNVGFKQDATATADQAARQAIAWLTTNSASLNSDDVGAAYYSSTNELADVTGQQLSGNPLRNLVDWDNNNCSSALNASYATCSLKTASATAVTGNPNTTRYVIFRLCSTTGDHTVATNNCAKPLAKSSGEASKKGAIDYTDPLRFSGTSGPYYRIVVRVEGARNTTSFTETIVHF